MAAPSPIKPASRACLKPSLSSLPYDYSPDGKPLGFTRSYNGEKSASFTPTGARIVERNPDGTPKKLVNVKYMPRGTGDAIQPVELTYMDDGEPYEAKQ